MNKILIDRELLERAVYRLELAYDADAPIVCDLSSVLSAPSGTPAMPVKAYYHETPNEYGGLNKSVGLEVRKQFNDAPLVLESDALAQIARTECEAQVSAAPMSEANVQGVVMPHSPYMPGSQPTDFTDYELGEIHGRIAMWEEVKRLNAAPAQQVSVPDERIIPTSAELIQWAWEEEPEETRFQEGYNAAKRWVKMQIEAGIAAPAAPAEDAPVRQATDGGRNQSYEGLFDGETEEQRASRLAAHRAKGGGVMKIGDRYNWKNQPERLVYVGMCEPRNGRWHQFEKVDEPGVVWCEVQPQDMYMLELTKEPSHD